MAIQQRNTAGVYETLDAGFYTAGEDTYYVTPGGRAWIVASADDLGTTDPVERLPQDLDGLDLAPADHLLMPEEAIEYCRQIEVVSGESLIETA